MEELQDILKNSVIPFLKANQSKHNNKVEPYEGYFDIVTKYNRILVHTESNVFPERLFTERAPNESEEEFKYRRANFKQITLPVFLDYLNTRGRAWHNSNWSIIYGEDNKVFGEQTLQNYLENGLYMHGSLINFVTSTMPKIKAQDPNGVLVVKPYKYDYKEIEGEQKINDQTLLEPTIYYYSCERVMGYVEDSYCLIEVNEKSVVEKNGKMQKDGHILEFHTPNAYYHIVQVGKYVDFKFEIVEVLTHNRGQMLCNKLGGIPNFINNKVVWESPFSYAIDHLDLALLKASNLFISESKSAYPVRIMLGNECDFFDGANRCVGGSIFTPNEDGMAVMKQCPSCVGTGLKNRISPNGELLFNGKDLQDSGVSSSEILRYVAPDSAILEYLRDGISIDINNGRKILHLQTTSDVANVNSESATMTNLENKALLSFVSQIAYQEFSMYEWLIDAIGYLRYGNMYVKPTVVRPVSFDFTTEQDYLQLLKTARDSNAPSSVIRLIMQKYISNIYFSTNESAKAFYLLLNADRLFEYNDNEVKMKLAQGTISKPEEMMHTSGIFFIQELVTENDKFFEQTFEVQLQQLNDKVTQNVVIE